MAETLHVLRVFVGPGGGGGNLLGVFLGAGGWSESRRQTIAADLGFSETVFIDDLARGGLRIHTPAVELPLAGHPLVGTSWLLDRHGVSLDFLRPPAGQVPTWSADSRTWISAPPGWAPEFDMRKLPSPVDVDHHPGAGPGQHLHVWSWQDETNGRVRVRVFPTALGISEDEATGSAALRLGELLERPLTIRQGEASEILARPAGDGMVAVGGRAALVETRDYAVSAVR